MSDAYLLTKKGHHFDFIHLERNVLDVEELAHAMANTCRFGGHCDPYYSVAQHSVLVASLVSSWNYRAALFHDAAEAYCGDVPTPLKQLLPDYILMIKRVEYWLGVSLGINIHDPEIKYADLGVCAVEKRDLMPPDVDWPCFDGIRIPDITIEPMLPKQAFDYFMNAYEALL